jgi:hypothetical protein
MMSRRSIISVAAAASAATGFAPLARATARRDRGTYPLGLFADAVGRSPTQLHQNFGHVIERHFELRAAEPWRMARLVSRLSALELQSLAQLYCTAVAYSGQRPRLLETMSGRLDAATLARVARHFGFSPVYDAIARNPASKQKGFDFLKLADTQVAAPVAGAALPFLQLRGASPNNVAQFLDMTPLETYLTFRTAPFGASLGVASSLFMTASIWSSAMYSSYYFGYGIGSYIAPLISTYAPSLYDTIGGTLNQIIENLQNVPNNFERGREEGAGSISFELGPIAGATLESTGGDYGALDAWADWADMTGGMYAGGGGSFCGWQNPDCNALPL